MIRNRQQKLEPPRLEGCDPELEIASHGNIKNIKLETKKLGLSV